MAFQASAGPHAKAEFGDSDHKDQNGNRQGHQATSFCGYRRAETGAMLDASVADGTMRASSDPEARALLVTLHGLAPVILRGHLERALGGDILSSAVLARLTLPSLELYTDGLYSDSTMLDAARAAIGTPEKEHS